MYPEKTIQFIEFISMFASIKRGTKIKGKNDFENDAEHSYQVALVSWYIIDDLKLDVNKQLVLEYALAHDLVEIYAGDTDSFNKNSKNNIESKHEREEKSLKTIMANFPNFTTLYKSIYNYENLNDKESQLVYIIDKMLPHINIYLTHDTYYKNNGVTEEDYERWFTSKLSRINFKDVEFMNLISKLKQFLKGKIVFN